MASVGDGSSPLRTTVQISLGLAALSLVSVGCGVFGGSGTGTGSAPGLSPSPRATLFEGAPVTATAPAAPPLGTPGPIEPAVTFPPIPEEDQIPVVNVDLKDGSISVDPTSLSVGIPYKFVVTNRGRQPHTLEVRTASVRGAPPSTVFTLAGGPLRPGASAEVFASFRLPGPYQLVCTLEGHRESGETASIGVL